MTSSNEKSNQVYADYLKPRSANRLSGLFKSEIFVVPISFLLFSFYITTFTESEQRASFALLLHIHLHT
jgi:hypothetical protein